MRRPPLRLLSWIFTVPLWGCVGVALEPYSSGPCESDLDCPSAYGCRVVSAEGARACSPLEGQGEGPGGEGGQPDGGPQGEAVPLFCDAVKPVLDTYCNGCHGADATASGQFQMRFDQYGNDAEGRQGAQASASRIQARTSDFKDMPPKSYAQQPTDAERALIQAWAEGGAPDCDAPADGGTNE